METTNILFASVRINNAIRANFLKNKIDMIEMVIKELCHAIVEK